MAASGSQTIQLYYSTTSGAAPSAGNLTSGEFAVNITDGKLYYKDNAGAVQVLATKGTGAIGGSNTQVQYNNNGSLAGSGNLLFDGTTLTTNALSLTNALTVGNGGTGATTLTGYVKGNGTSAMTASSTIPNTDISGLGTMSTQNANSVAITGGTVNGTSIGATTASTGSFTSLTDSGNLNFTGTGNRITGDFSNATVANRVMFQTSTVNGNTVLSTLPNGTATTSALRLYNATDTANNANFVMSVSSSTASLESQAIGTGTYLPMTFYTGGSERVRIDTSGNVGIGTASPGQRLVVEQNQAAYSYFDYNNTTNGGGIVWRQIVRNLANTGTTSVDFAKLISSGFAINNNDTGSGNFTAFGVGASERLRIDSSGNVGIGTSSPSYRLHARTDGASSTNWVTSQNATASGAFGAGFIGLADAGSKYFMLYENGDGAAALTNAFAGPILLGTNNTERARIDSSGNFMVGTTSSSPNPGVFVAPSGAMSIGNNAQASGWGFINFLRSGTAIGSISQNGTTAVAYNTSSDYRLKNITGPVTNSGAYIDSLKPVEGTWKADGSTFVGLIAHEVQEVSRTQVATGEKDGEQMQAMDYSSAEIIANLIAEVQSLRKRLAAAGIA